MSEKLKPCPFCGSPGWIQTSLDGKKIVECQSQICTAGLGSDCWQETPEEAAKAWNTRVADKRIAGLEGLLEEALESLEGSGFYASLAKKIHTVLHNREDA